jgi:hypothetical protein
MGAIPFRFWAQSSDDQDVEDEPSTPEFVKEAVEAGFTVKELSRAERALESGTVSSPGYIKLAKSIVAKLVQRKTSGRPWQGPIPPPRVTPPRTLGDVIATASY